MNNSSRWWTILFGAIFSNALMLEDALAQPAPAPAGQSSSPVQLAHEMADKAFGLFDEKKWPEAFDAFEKAEGIVHSAEFVLHMARCQEKRGKLLEAANLYRWIIAEEPQVTTKPGYKRALTNARIAAKEELAQLNTRIPTIRIKVQGVNGRLHRLTVAGIPRVPLDERIQVNPDKPFWVVLWYGEGHNVARVLTLPEGKSEELSIVMPPDDPQEKVASKMVDGAKNNPKNDAKSDVAWKVFFGVAGAGMLTGVGFMIAGATLDARASEAWASCPPNTCSAAQERARESLDTAATLSGVGFGTFIGTPLVGGLIAAWIWPKKPARRPVVPVVSATGFALRGTF